jgi:hypothetical protein
MYEAKEFAEREAKVVEERDVETVEERDVSIEKRACASGKKLCNGNCIPNAYTCCYGDGCPLYISG